MNRSWLVLAAVFCLLGAFRAKATDCFECTIEGCYNHCSVGPPLDPPPLIGYLPYSDGHGIQTMPIYQYDGRSVDRSWPLGQNNLGRHLAQEVCDQIGCDPNLAAVNCGWRGSYPPMFTCDDWSLRYFYEPFVWLFTQAAPDLLFTMIERESFMGQFGFDCVGTGDFCTWEPWSGPGCWPDCAPP